MTGHLAAAALSVLVLACVPAEREAPKNESRQAGEAAPRREVPASRQAYFGDLHVHTVFSLDSYLFSNALTPADAYRFARGEPVTLVGGRVHRLETPLDFAAVTDHVETLVEYARCVEPGGPFYSEPICEAIRDRDLEMLAQLRRSFQESGRHPEQICPEGAACAEAAHGPWQEIRAAAAAFDSPGRFTTFVAFEYSPPLPDGGMLHRNVVFRGAEAPATPLGAYELPTAADLWRWLEEECTGACEATSIPHNSNFSWGLSFDRAATLGDGDAKARASLARRARLERVAEIVQHKGSSECAFGLGTNDEECRFEQIFPPCAEGQETACARSGSYLRNALQDGLTLEAQTGSNPFKLGLIGSTDTHNGIPGAVAERRFEGHFGEIDSSSERRLTGQMVPAATARRLPGHAGTTLYNPGGLAGVWAEENTRDAIFQALVRRETFATSGPRIRVRFFGGWSYPENLHLREDAVKQAYAGGVPMGGDLIRTDGGQAPTFIVLASMDPSSAGLDRIQVIKGWTSKGNGSAERIYDIGCAGDRVPDPTAGRCPDSRAEVDLSDCAIDSSAGAAELGTFWRDPDFDRTQRAFYYVRVLENPTCRWTTWDSLRSGRPLVAGVPATIQERAWSSPIWYSPAASD